MFFAGPAAILVAELKDPRFTTIEFEKKKERTRTVCDEPDTSSSK